MAAGDVEGARIAPAGLISPTLFVYGGMRSGRRWRGNNKHATVAGGFLLVPPAGARIRTAGGGAKWAWRPGARGPALDASHGTN